MATASQRAWVKRHREAAAKEPSKYATVRIQSSIDRARADVKAAKSKAAAGGRKYRGPTTEQVAAKTLAKTPISTAHRQQARTASLTQSGIRGGQTPAQAAAQATKTVYGVSSTQARRAHDVLIKERQITTAKQKVIADMKRGVISGVKVSGIPTSVGYNPRHSTQMIDPRIHVGTGKRPEIVETISENQKRVRMAYLQLQSDESKLQRSQTQLYLAEQRLNKYPVKDGIFVGTEAQYKRYLADHNKYTTKYKEVDGQIDKYNTDLKKAEVEGYRLEHRETAKRRAKYGGLAGVHEDIERKVSEKIPTLEDISKKGAEFRREHPKVAATIYTTFEKAHAKTEHVGTQSQRNAMAGYTYGSYSSLQKQPVKTAVSFAIGGASVKAIKMAGLVGKAYGAGKWTKRMAKAAQYGLIAYYGIKSAEHIMSAPNSYVAGQRAANIMYTEVLPMAAGIKAITVAPKVARVVIKKGKLTAKEFEAGSRQLLKDTEAKTHMSFGKTQKQKLEDAIKSMRKKKGEDLTDSEIKTLEKTFGTKRLRTAEEIHKKQQAERKAEAAEIKRKIERGELKEVKIGTGAQQQIQLVKVKVKPLTKQTLKQVAKVKEQFELLSKPVVKPKVVQKPVQKVKVLTEAQKAESARLQKQATLKQAAYQKEMQALADQMPAFKRKVMVKTVQKQVSESKTITKQIIQLKQKYNQKLITRQVYMQKLAQLNKQKLKLAQQQTQLQKTVTKVKPLTAQKFAQQLTTSFTVIQLFKQAQKQEAKLKAKQLPKQKQKIVPLLTPAQEAALTTKQDIAAARKAAVAEKVTPKPPRKVTPKPVRKPAVKEPKLIVPPVGPPPKRKAKKKPIRKDRQIVTYTPIQFKNRVATIASLFG